MEGRGSHSGVRGGAGGSLFGRRSPAGIVGGGGGGGAPGGSARDPTTPDPRDRLRDPNGQQATEGPGGPRAPVVPEGQKPRSLENFENHQREWERQHFESRFTEAEREYLREQFKRVFDNNGFYMNIRSEHLENVMDEHFKNQFETGGRSGGASFDPHDLTPSNGRVDAAEQLFGLDWRNMRPEDYEKYGSMQTLDLLTAASRSPSGYGDALVRFKRDSVLGRTTYTIGDSLGPAEMGELVAGNVSSGDFTGIPVSELADFLDRVRRAEQYVTDAQLWNNQVESGWGSYLELQYHGMLTMFDVESIVFTRSYNIPDARVLNRLRAYGIKLYKYEGGRLVAL